MRIPPASSLKLEQIEWCLKNSSCPKCWLDSNIHEVGTDDGGVYVVYCPHCGVLRYDPETYLPAGIRKDPFYQDVDI